MLPLQNQRGQVAIFIALISTLLFMLFGMTINFAMLVHEKINLQNAADMAAYAGAAEQARILNIMSWKNYELRKVYKEILYLTWIRHNSRHPNFPRSPNQAVDAPWKQGDLHPSICQGDFWETAPTDRRLCEAPPSRRRVRPFRAPPLTPFTALAGTIVEGFTLDLADDADKLTAENRRYVEELVTYWPPRAENILQTYFTGSQSLVELMNQEARAPEFVIEPTGTQGNHFTASPPQGWLNHEAAAAAGPVPYRYNPNPLPSRLPADINFLAYQTAFKNLSRSNKNGFKFLNLAPKTGEYVAIEQIRRTFHIFYTSFTDTFEPLLYEREVKATVADYPIGVKKDPRVMTYYAIMLRSKPKLPFMPGKFQWELRTYAAAQPFGGRIGPEEDPLYPDSETEPPNMSFFEGDTLGLKSAERLHFHATLGGAVPNHSGFDDAGNPQAFHLFLAPNEYEAHHFHFNPDNPAGTDLPTPAGVPQLHLANTIDMGYGNRNGYSVRWVNFKTLLQAPNPPLLPSDVQEDLLKILH